MKDTESYPLANLVSWIFHPLLAPTYGVFLVFYLNTYLDYSIPGVLKIAIYSIVFLSTCVLPTLSVFSMLKTGFVNSLHLQGREERQVPFIVTTAFYIVCYYLLLQLRLPSVFQAMMLGTCVSVFMALIINFWWKISIHAIGMGGLCGIVFALSQNIVSDMVMPFSVCILISGFVGTARMFAGQHQISQIYTGFILGFLCEYSIMSI